MPCIHVVPDFGGALMTMSVGLRSKSRHARLSAWTEIQSRVGNRTPITPTLGRDRLPSTRRQSAAGGRALRAPPPTGPTGVPPEHGVPQRFDRSTEGVVVEVFTRCRATESSRQSVNSATVVSRENRVPTAGIGAISASLTSRRASACTRVEPDTVREPDGGAGGNRTPVHQPVNELATTIPDIASDAETPAGRLSARGGPRSVFPERQRSFPPSAVFPTVIGYFCCRAVADWPRAAFLLTMTLRSSDRDQAARANCSSAILWFPRLASLRNSGRKLEQRY